MYRQEDGRDATVCAPTISLAVNPTAIPSTISEPAIAMRFLLTSAMRVSRAWHALIASSPRLQGALFFLHVRSPVNSEGNQARFNPLLLSVFPYWFQLWSGDSWDVLCEALFSTPREMNPDVVSEAGGTYPGIAHPNASWRRMYPVLPPIRRVEFYVSDF